MRIDLSPDDDAAKWPATPVLIAVTLCWLILVWPWLSGQVTVPWDAKAHFLPQVQFLARSLAAGESPFWTPFVFSGHPQIADPQAMVFSVPMLALATLNPSPGPWAFDATVHIGVLIGMMALALWCRDQGWHPAAALLAALAFGFGAAMAWRIQHTVQVLSLAHLPLVMLLVERALQRGSIVYGLCAGVVASLLVLGRDQVAFLSVYFLIGYVLWRVFRHPGRLASNVRRSIMPLGTAVLAGLAVITIPIVLTIALVETSNRPAIDLVGAGRGSLHPGLLLTALIPDLFGASGRMEDYWGPPSFAWKGTGLFIAQNVGQLYIGAVPALLILFGAWRGLLVRGEIAFFTGAGVAVLIYALGWYTPGFGLMHAWLPGVDLFRRPADAVFLIGFMGAVLAGYVAHVVLSEGAGARPALRIGGAGLTVVAAFVVATVLAVLMERVQQALAPWLVAAAIMALAAFAIHAAVWLNPIRPIAAGMLLVGLTVADLAYSNGPNGATALPPDHYDVLRPGTDNETIARLRALTEASSSATRRDRVELVGLEFHWPNASLTHRLEHTLGYNPIRFGPYARATGAGDIAQPPGRRQGGRLLASYDSLLADMLGLRYIATGTRLDDEAASGLRLVARTRDGFIYENADAMARVRFVPDSKTVDFTSIVEAGEWPRFEPERTVLLEHNTASTPSLTGRAEGTARLMSYANTEIITETESDAPGYLILNDIWHPWWRAWIDGKQTEILRANVLFRAVMVPAGRHRVRFSFEPVSAVFEDWFGADTEVWAAEGRR